MASYAVLDFYGKVNKYDKRKLEKLNRILAGEVENPFELWDFDGGRFTVDENGIFNVELEDYYGLFGSAEDIAHYLADVIKDGFAQLMFIEEDSEAYGYYITPGNVVGIQAVYVPEPVFDKVKAVADEYCKIPAREMYSVGDYPYFDFCGDTKEYDKEKLERLNRILAGEEKGPFEPQDFYGYRFEILNNGSLGVSYRNENIRFRDGGAVAQYLADTIKDGFIQLFIADGDGKMGGYYITPGNATAVHAIYVPEPVLDKVEKIVEECYNNLGSGYHEADSFQPAPSP